MNKPSFRRKEELLEYKDLVDALYCIRKEDGYSFDKLARWMNEEGFFVSGDTLNNVFKQYLGDPLGKTGHPRNPRRFMKTQERPYMNLDKYKTDIKTNLEYGHGYRVISDWLAKMKKLKNVTHEDVRKYIQNDKGLSETMEKNRNVKILDDFTGKGKRKGIKSSNL